MSLRGQDIVVALKTAVSGEALSYADLGKQVGISASQAHSAVQRAIRAGLLFDKPRRVNSAAMLEFLVHGLKYLFPPEQGPVARGVPTAHSALPLSEEIAGSGLPVVWPYPQGTVRGQSLKPIHKSAIQAALNDSEMHQLLALADAIRVGKARERNLAIQHLTEVLRHRD